MRVAIISYNSNHLKTRQVLEQLLLLNSKDEYEIFALPFIPRPKRDVTFEHRPDQFTGEDISVFAENSGIPFKACQSDTEIMNGFDYYLIAGAGILSKEAVSGKKIINCHPGIIPQVKGLDAFKWAIMEKKPVGNTLHFIDEEVDAGEIIAIRQTPLYIDDTLQSFADRHYSAEIEMLVNYKQYLRNPVNAFSSVDVGSPRMRMPLKYESKLQEYFDEYVKLFGQERE